MSQSKEDQAAWSPPLEAITKVGGILIAACIFFGIAYNIAFFFGSKIGWLFFLSVADNIVAAMYAIPHALLVVLGFSIMAVFFRQDGALGRISRVKVFYGMFVLAVVGGIIVRLDLNSGGFLPAWVSGWLAALLTCVIFFGLVPLLIYGIAWLIREGSKVPANASTFYPVTIAFLVLLIFSAVAFVARVDRDRLERARAMSFELPDRNSVTGKLVRALADGFIVAQGDNWIWLPRGEVKRVSEVP